MKSKTPAQAGGAAMHGVYPVAKDGQKRNSTRTPLPDISDMLTDAGTLDVLRRYFPNFKKLKQVFKTQHSKRVNIYQHGNLYLVKDYAAKEFPDDKARNVIQVIEHYHNCDFKEAAAILAQELGYTPVTHQTYLQRPAKPQRVAITPEPQVKLVEVEAGHWRRILAAQDSNFHYYARSLGVTAEHLAKWRVGSEAKADAVYTVFGISDQAGARVNLKHFKFSSTGNRDQKQNPFYLKNPKGKKHGQGLYGAHLLRDGVPVVVVESEKTAVLASFFYPQYDFVATGGATALSTKIKALKGRKGYVLHDADPTGRKLSTWQALHQAGLDFVPVELFPDKSCGYDLADAIRDGLRPNIGGWQHQAGLETYTLHVKQYAAEEAASFCEALTHYRKMLLQGGTGIGKTTLALNYIAPYWPGRIIIVEPLTVIVDAIAKQKYGDIAVIKQGATAEDIQTALHSKVTVCTYDSYAKIDNLTDDDLIIADEIHTLHTLYSIPGKRPKYEYLFNRLLTAKNVLLVSATPPAFYSEYGFKKAVFQAGTANQITIAPKTYKTKPHHELARLLPTLDYAQKQYVIRLNSFDLIKRVQASFKGLAPDQIAVLGSETKDQQGGVYQSIIETKHIPAHIRLVFTTSIADCGVDIYNEQVEGYIIEHTGEALTVQDTLQAVARYRRAEGLKFTVYKQQREGKAFDKQAAKQAILEFAEYECNHMNALNARYLQASPYVATENCYCDTAKYCDYNHNTQRYEINHLRVHHELEQAEARAMAPAEFFKQLANNSHITMLEPQQTALSVSAEMLEIDQATKATKESKQQQALALLQEHEPTDVYTAIYHSSKDIDTRQRIAEAGYNLTQTPEALSIQEQYQELIHDRDAMQILKRFLKLQRRGVNECDIVPLLSENRSPRRFGDLITTLETRNLINNADRLNLAQRRDAERILENKQALLNAVTELEYKRNKSANPVTEQPGLTADQVTAIVNRNRHRANKKTKDQAMQLFRILFEVETMPVKVNGKTVKYFGVLADLQEPLRMAA